MAAAEAERCFGERRVVAEIADVARDDDCARLVAVELEKFDRLDILVIREARLASAPRPG